MEKKDSQINRHTLGSEESYAKNETVSRGVTLYTMQSTDQHLCDA